MLLVMWGTEAGACAPLYKVTSTTLPVSERRHYRASHLRRYRCKLLADGPSGAEECNVHTLKAARWQASQSTPNHIQKFTQGSIISETRLNYLFSVSSSIVCSPPSQCTCLPADLRDSRQIPKRNSTCFAYRYWKNVILKY
jgi:hypothetical protein